MFWGLFKTKKEIQAEKVLSRAEELKNELEQRVKSPVFTTIRTFREPGEYNAYMVWIKSVITSDEYRFLVFQLRENTIMEMVGVTDADKIKELNSRLNMLMIIDKYLHHELENYETQIRRSEENTTR